MMFRVILLTLLGLLLGMTCLAQTTQPDAAAAVELRANEAFVRGEYSSALPLLKKARELFATDTDKAAMIDEKIRVCEQALAAAATMQPDQGGPDVETSAEKRTRHVRPADGKTLELTIKELGNFDYDADKGGNIPQDVKELTGSRLRLRGFMIPMDQAEAITQFALVPSLFACCFGQPPQLQHTIVVNCPKGKAVAYYPDEIVVDGTLKVEEKREDDFIVSIFEVDCTSVKPASK